MGSLETRKTKYVANVENPKIKATFNQVASIVQDRKSDVDSEHFDEADFDDSDDSMNEFTSPEPGQRSEVLTL